MSPDVADLRERLVGHRFPGGRVTVRPYEAWLGHDAMRSPNTGGDVLDPLWILVAGLRGMGTDIAGLVALAESTPDRVLLGELGLRQATPLRAGVEYGVTGRIVEVTRRSGRRAGVFDTVTFELELADGEQAVAGLTSSFLFPPGAGVTRIPERAVVVDAGPMKVFSLLTADPNPIHWDAETPVNQGGLNLGYVIGAVSAWAGSSAAIREVSVRFRGAVHAGDRVTAGGEVEEVHDGFAHLRVWLRDEQGTDLVTGTVTVDVEARL